MFIHVRVELLYVIRSIIIHIMKLASNLNSSLVNLNNCQSKSLAKLKN